MSRGWRPRSCARSEFFPPPSAPMMPVSAPRITWCECRCECRWKGRGRCRCRCRCTSFRRSCPISCRVPSRTCRSSSPRPRYRTGGWRGWRRRRRWRRSGRKKWGWRWGLSYCQIMFRAPRQANRGLFRSTFLKLRANREHFWGK